MKCPQCDAVMQPLLTSMFCPNSCDKIDGPRCPDCRSSKTEQFDISGILDCFASCDEVRDSVTFHCWPCGHVWNVEAQKPESD